MEQNPLVSVIVVVFNSSEFVVETLESIKCQTYKEIELIITDDLSIDNTVEKCNNWIKDNASRFVKTQLITSNKNTGVPSNCNRGVYVASGKWIKIIAGDDVLIETCIERNINYITANKDIKILFSYINEYNSKLTDELFISRIPSNYPRLMTLNTFQQYKYLLLSGGIHYTPSSFICNEVFKEIGYFDEKYFFIEDYPFWLNATKKGIHLHFMEEETVKYRRHSGSIHNIPDNVIVKPSFFRNIQFIRDYIYPNITWYHRFDMKYKYQINKFTYNCFNKKTKVNNMMYKLLIKYLNPFTYIKMICVR